VYTILVNRATMFSKTNILLASSFSSFAFAAVHNIAVGDGGLIFEPESIDNLAQGDTLVFRLYPNHDVVQGNFDSPCTPSDGGFYSGPFSDTDDGEKRFVVNVTDDGPHYWYCSVQRHCQDGMVGGANVP
jgi:plastocyanin